jgi:hypothetical protein
MSDLILFYGTLMYYDSYLINMFFVLKYNTYFQPSKMLQGFKYSFYNYFL